MNWRPGPKLLKLGALAAGLGVLCFLVPVAAWLVPAVAIIALIQSVADIRELKRNGDSLEVERVLPAVVGRGRAFFCELVVKNQVDREAWVEIRDVLPAGTEPGLALATFNLGPRQSHRMVYSVSLPVRGRHAFGPVWLRRRGRFGVIEHQRRLPVMGEIKVLPPGIAAKEGLDKSKARQAIQLDKLSRARRQGEGSEFETLTEFHTGDDTRRIDWRSSTRHSRLLVRRFVVEQHRDLVIVIDCGRLMGAEAGDGNKLDRAIDAALMLGRTALEYGDRCGMGLFDDRVLGYLPPLSGARAFNPLIESVYDARCNWRESNFGVMFATIQARQRKRSLVVVLSDLVDVDTTHRFRAALASLARRHVVVFVALRTPVLDAIQAPIENVGDMAHKAVTLRLLRERERAIHTIRRSGIHVLDVEPAELTVPLVNQYIHLRARNLL